jgi:hypothetical protein
MNYNISMKLNILTLVTTLTLLSAVCFAQEKSKKQLQEEQKALQQQQTEVLINGKTFDFTARTALPQGGRSVNLSTDPNQVKFRPEVIECYMPYFGRSYGSAAYGGDSGMKFKGTPEAYSVTKGKKNFTVKATVKGSNDTYKLILTVGFEGNATFSVTCNNRSPISYNGAIAAPANPDEKK